MPDSHNIINDIYLLTGKITSHKTIFSKLTIRGKFPLLFLQTTATRRLPLTMGFMAVCKKGEMGLSKTVNTSFGPLGYPFVPRDTKRTPAASITGIGKI